LITRFETLLSERPDQPDQPNQSDGSEVRLILAEACLRIGRSDAAISHYVAVLAEAPHHAEAHDRLGLALLQAGRVDDAEQHHAAAARARPEWVVAQVGLARVEVERGEFDAAIRRYRRWLPKSSDARTLFGLGQALIRAGRLAEAEVHFEEMASSHPRWPESHIGRGQLARKRDDQEAALRHFEAAQAIDPLRADVQAELGFLFAMSDDAARAREHLDRARLLGLHSPALEVKLGLLAQKSGEIGTAIVHYRVALTLDARDLAASNNLAWILATSAEPELRMPQLALRIANKMTRAWPDAGPDPVDTLAAAQAAVGYFDEAAKTALRAEELARRAGRTSLAAEIGSRAALYRAGRPFREASRRASSTPSRSENPSSSPENPRSSSENPSSTPGDNLRTLAPAGVP